MKLETRRHNDYGVDCTGQPWCLDRLFQNLHELERMRKQRDELLAAFVSLNAEFNERIGPPLGENDLAHRDRIRRMERRHLIAKVTESNQ